MDKKHLIKIVGYLLEDIIIDYDNTTIQLIGSDLEYDIEFIHDGFFDMMWNKLEDNYGLNGDEIVYVLGNYLYQINKKIKLPGYINESVDNKEKYLDKIVQYIIDDTEIDYDEGEIKYPYYSNILLLQFHQLPFSVHSFRAFSIYCKDMYGLDIEEIQYVWEKYKSIVDDKGSINESVDSKKIYLDKVVQFMVDDTFIDYDREEIRLPFFLISFFFFPKPFVFRPFSNYVKDTYGLTEQEVKYVWERYNRIVVDKVNQK
jgi:hypothetical protein